jgi:hypothetical protein
LKLAEFFLERSDQIAEIGLVLFGEAFRFFFENVRGKRLELAGKLLADFVE